jgi:hypothetical protein
MEELIDAPAFGVLTVPLKKKCGFTSLSYYPSAFIALKIVTSIQFSITNKSLFEDAAAELNF